MNGKKTVRKGGNTKNLKLKEEKKTILTVTDCTKSTQPVLFQTVKQSEDPAWI